jgi:hypothetical protein
MIGSVFFNCYGSSKKKFVTAALLLTTHPGPLPMTVDATKGVATFSGTYRGLLMPKATAL